MAKKVKDRWQIALYVPPELEKRLRNEAKRQRRSHNATVVEILRAHFYQEDAKQSTEGDYANPASQ